MITRKAKHNNCPTKAFKGPFGPHFGKLVCMKHSKHIQWLNEADYKAIQAFADGIKERSTHNKYT